MSGSTKPKKAAGRKPDYDVSYLNKVTGASGRIGAAWLNKQTGSISVTLNALVTVSASPDALITLFPANRSTEQADGHATGDGQRPPF